MKSTPFQYMTAEVALIGFATMLLGAITGAAQREASNIQTWWWKCMVYIIYMYMSTMQYCNMSPTLHMAVPA